MNLRSIVQNALDEALTEHDRHYHPDGFRKGDSCSLRDAREKGDLADDVSCNEGEIGFVRDFSKAINREMSAGRDVNHRLAAFLGDNRKWHAMGWNDGKKALEENVGFVRLFHDDDIDDLSEDLLGSPSFIRMVSRDGCSPGKARERMRALVKETLAYPESPRHGTWKPEKNEKCNWKLRSGDKVNLLFFYDWLCRNAGGEE